MNKIIIRDKMMVTIYCNSPEGLIHNINETVNDIKTKYPDAHDLGTEIETEDDYGCICANLYITFKRTETDEEYQTRMNSEARRLEVERKYYEKLKAKFEGDK